MKDVWLYSWDDECFGSDEYESREEAIQGANKTSIFSDDNSMTRIMRI
ncbi:TPA: hypothetical protein ACKOR7_001913 [Clostridioides difficile]